MQLKPGMLRVAKRVGLAALALLFAAVISIQVQQRIFRYRAEHLLADMQAIRLHQSSWRDAQALLHRWGAWGHYDGTCTFTNCRYKIVLMDEGSRLYSELREESPLGFMRNPLVLGLYQLIGGRLGEYEADFIVQDGTIWRTTNSMTVGLPPQHLLYAPDEPGSVLMVGAQSRQSLREFLPGSRWELGGNEQLAEHPEYKVGRPSGCESCLAAGITYAIQADQHTVRQLTDFQFDCFTRLAACRILEDVIPAAKEWHLYEPPWGLPFNEPTYSATPLPCRTPVWALGRDASAAIAVEALAVTQSQAGNDRSETASVRLVETLKGPALGPDDTQLVLHPYPGQAFNPSFESAEAPEHLMADKKYLIIVNGMLPQVHGQSFSHKFPAPEKIELDRCGVLDDTSQNRLELQRGFALNDRLRVPEF